VNFHPGSSELNMEIELQNFFIYNSKFRNLGGPEHESPLLLVLLGTVMVSKLIYLRVVSIPAIL